MELKPNIATLIGFAAKSRKLLLGTYSVEEGIRGRKAHLVLVAEDTAVKVKDLLPFYWQEE